MPTVNDYIASIGGICGAEKDIIVTLRYETKDTAIASIIQRSTVKKSVSGYMVELEFQNTTFRLFRNGGKVVFRGIKNKKELNRLLSALLL